MEKAIKLLTFLMVMSALLIPASSFANLGVGVGTGKIELDAPIKPGGLYALPPLTVINTGDEVSDYGVSVEYKEEETRMRPAREWFVFSPGEFNLEPGQSQIVQIQVNVPIKTVPGDYFAYLEGHPVRKSSSSGGATVGIGAAAKLYFTVAPANIFQGIYYRVLFLVTTNAPWSYIILALLAASVLVALFKKYFSFNIGIKKKAGE